MQEKFFKTNIFEKIYNKIGNVYTAFPLAPQNENIEKIPATATAPFGLRKNLHAQL